MREKVSRNLSSIVDLMNFYLKGKKLSQIETILKRLERGGDLPHWFNALKESGALPNLDGKTIGSIVEKLFVCILEVDTFKKEDFKFVVNPARGVDLPDLDLSIKSPSDNNCTSEPFYSPYQRLYGSDYDAVVLLTDYQTKKQTPPLKLQIVKCRYLTKTQIADKALCEIALKHRAWLLKIDEQYAKRLMKFLSFVNQSDWRASQLKNIVTVLDEPTRIEDAIKGATRDFNTKNRKKESTGKPLIEAEELETILRIQKITPLYVGVLDAIENWTSVVLKENGRMPNEEEWQRLKNGKLDGQIGMSFALQWRFNFGNLFL